MFQTSRKHLTKTLLATLLLTSIDAMAAQVLSGRPDETLAASVSRTEPTLIRVDGHRIRRVFGAEGDFVVIPDKDTGTAYLKPMADKQAFGIFVADDAGRTWKLLLSVTDGPSDSIVIKGKDRPSGSAPAKDTERNRVIKRLIAALDAGDEESVDIRKVNQIVPLWKEAMFVLVKVIDGPFKAEQYMLTNVSGKQMVIDERELYRKGVVAVAIDKPILMPSETTAIYIISEGDAR